MPFWLYRRHGSSGERAEERREIINGRLTHDAAVAMAHALLDMVKPCLREEEYRLALQEFYQICRAGIEAYELQHNRQQQRLRPLDN
jgi:hypothetical protein